jgi:hypothetical protein
MRSGSREAEEIAEQIVAAHNAEIERVAPHRHSAGCGHFNGDFEL